MRKHGGVARERGLTLIELLVAIGTMGILAVLFTGVAKNALNSASKVREINAARQLVTALQTSALENNGIYLPGMDYRAGTGETPVYNPDGDLVQGHAAQRYPFRLGPYLGNNFEGTIFVNRNEKEILKRANGPGPMYDYYVSTFPALGMNIYCVGGVVRSDGSILNGSDCISRSATMRGSILAFASAGSGTGNARTHGFSYVSPPTREHDSPICMKWQDADTWTADKNPMDYGWVDFRYKGKAVCAFLDGSVRMLSVAELSDMRLWTPSALDADDPNYVIAPP